MHRTQFSYLCIHNSLWEFMHEINYNKFTTIPFACTNLRINTCTDNNSVTIAYTTQCSIHFMKSTASFHNNHFCICICNTMKKVMHRQQDQFQVTTAYTMQCSNNAWESTILNITIIYAHATPWSNKCIKDKQINSMTIAYTTQCSNQCMKINYFKSITTVRITTPWNNKCIHMHRKQITSNSYQCIYNTLQ